MSILRPFILGLLVGVSPAFAQSVGPLYDGTKWTLEQHAETNFDSSAAVQVLLLKASQPSDANLPWLYEVQLLIVRDGRVLFDYIKTTERERQTDDDLKFFVDDDLTIQDVTGDGVPEVIFHSGYTGASDGESLEHILQFDSRLGSFVELAPGQFVETGTSGLRWMTLGKQSILVTSRRGKWPSANVHEQCHYCPSPFIYEAYEWNARRNSFVRTRNIVSSRQHHSGSEALQDEWEFIRNQLLGNGRR